MVCANRGFRKPMLAITGMNEIELLVDNPKVRSGKEVPDRTAIWVKLLPLTVFLQVNVFLLLVVVSSFAGGIC